MKQNDRIKADKWPTFHVKSIQILEHGYKIPGTSWQWPTFSQDLRLNYVLVNLQLSDKKHLLPISSHAMCFHDRGGAGGGGWGRGHLQTDS